MKISDLNYYGFDHDNVIKKFSGGLTYVTTMCIDNQYSPWAIYLAAAPDVSKGHKEYMLLCTRDGVGYVSGRTAEQLESQWVQGAIKCPVCKDIIISINRHDYTLCTCKACMIDGGRDYERRSLNGIAGSYHHLTKVFTPTVDVDKFMEDNKPLMQDLEDNE
jgi:hypothetical protein